MSFIEELKRRNVAKVAVLYVVFAWLLLQVTDVLSSLLPVPEWTGSLVFVLLLIGFPTVLTFSWIYELTPEGIKREKEVDRSQSITHQTGRKINILIVVLLEFVLRDKPPNLVVLAAFAAYNAVIIFTILAMSNPYSPPGAVRPLAFEEIFRHDMAQMLGAVP